MNIRPKKLVFCLEGIHGSGKSSVLRRLSELGFKTLDEGFIPEKELPLHPQSYFGELSWIVNWFQRLVKDKGNVSNQEEIIIADRSPYSAMFYARDIKDGQGPGGQIFKACIDQCIKEYRELGIEIITIHLQVDYDVLRQRILYRLEKEPIRKCFNEHLDNYNQTIWKRYDSFAQNWDFVVNNSQNDSLSEVCDQIINFIHSRKTLPSRGDSESFMEPMLDENL